MYTWVPGQPFAAARRAFAESYADHPASVSHELVIMVKGTAAPRSRRPDLIRARWIAVGEDGYDIGPFMALALGEYRDYDRVVLMGAYSRILGDGWLAKLTAAGPLASATGSYEIRPHLRTTALSVAPYLLALMFDPPDGWSKKDCWRFEHGPDNLFATAREHGVEGVVVGRDGVAYREADWPGAGIYRIGHQPNLLVADNHTDLYAGADTITRARLSSGSWAEPENILDPWPHWGRLMEQR